jgi:methionyl-tRNA formyltransferase
MKVVLWIGNEANQKALANKIAKDFNVVGIVRETRKTTSKITLKILFEKTFEKLFLPSIGKSWFGMKNRYDKLFNDYPNTKIQDVENINSDEAFNFSTDLKPDLIIVSGTRLVKEKMLNIQPKIGILNLHTGLSPYIKGGPNCSNWCIATEQFHLIGNTIMWIDLGIDTGNILTTEFTPLSGNETLIEIHIKVMEHAHELYLKAIHHVALGGKNSVKQDSITKGKTYYSKEWNLKQKINLVKGMRKFKKAVNTNEYLKKRKKINIIEI